MRRAALRLQMAKAISETLPMGFQLSYSNVRRYVTRDRLTSFNIRRDTPIHESDWTVAISVAREERVNRGSTKAHERELLRKRNLADVMREHYKTHPR